MTALRLGSLFDGIGVFPLAAVRCGIEPVWASEIEKAPISITTRHFPDMVHLGDVTKLDGRDLPPVHIITFGSPCQNLSQIGNRKGLAGEKSSLFFQAIRIIREMREATNGLFPAIAVWENVMGAFSSNDRMDFRAVLSAFTDTDVSMPASGRWAGAGMVRGRTPDLSWRLMDAQHWASPRLARRQRIFLVADFGGRRSHEILFKPRTMQSLPALGGDRGLPAACGDRGSFIEAGRRVPITRPFQCFRMRASAKERTETAFRNSFGLPTDPFPTLLYCYLLVPPFIWTISTIDGSTKKPSFIRMKSRNQYLLFLLLQQYLFAVIYLTTWFSMIYILAIWHGERYLFVDMFSSYIRYLLSFFLLANISEMLKRTKNKMLSTMPFISAYLLLLIDEQVIQSVTNRNGITIRLIFSWTFQPLGLVLLPVFLAITTLLLLRLNRTYDIF